MDIPAHVSVTKSGRMGSPLFLKQFLRCHPAPQVIALSTFSLFNVSYGWYH